MSPEEKVAAERRDDLATKEAHEAGDQDVSLDELKQVARTDQEGVDEDLEVLDPDATVWSRLAWIWDLWQPLRFWFIVLFLLTVVSTAVALAYPLVFMLFLNGVQDISPGYIPEVVWTAALLLIAIGLARFAASYYPATRAYINGRIEMQVRERYFDVVLKKGYRFFQRFRTGDLVTRLTDDISEYPRIAWFSCSGIFRAVESSAKFSVSLLVIFMLDERVALLALIPLPFMVLIFVLVHRRLGKAAEVQRRAQSETNEILESAFSGIRILKAFGAGDRTADVLDEQLQKRIPKEMRLVELWQLVESLFTTVNTIGQMVVVVVGGYLVLNGDLEVGTFYALYVYMGMLFGPMMDIPNLFVTAKQAFVNIDREEQLRKYDIPGEGGAFKGSWSPSRFESLSLREVDFTYPARRASEEAGGGWGAGSKGGPGATPALIEAGPRSVLHGIDLEIKRGDWVAIVGRVGSGKTTMLNIVSGVLVPDTGKVELNGRPISESEAAGFGRLVGLMPQEPILFSESVRENVVFGREEDEDRLWASLQGAGIKEEIEALPDGLDQNIGELGITLSGGQKQRLVIARALYGDPQVLLLDDLTSALDAENEDRLWATIHERLPEATVVVITHRIATARAMDRIHVLQGGSFIASGTHEELLEKSDLYREFQQDWGDGNGVSSS